MGGGEILNFNLVLNIEEDDDYITLTYECILPDSSLFDLYSNNLIAVDKYIGQVDKNIIEAYPISINNILVTNVGADINPDGTIMGEQFYLLNEKNDGFWGLSSEIESIVGGRKYFFDPLVLFPNELYLFGYIEKETLITFTINGVQYQAEKGMTWNEWVNSSYNDNSYSIYGTSVRHQFSIVCTQQMENVTSTDIIQNNEVYIHYDVGNGA